MDRRRAKHRAPGFPCPHELPDRRQVLAGLAALAGGTTLAALNWGCVGDIAYPDDFTSEAVLPAPPQTRQVLLADGMSLRYHVDVVLGDRDLDACVNDTQADGAVVEAVLEALDAVLLPHESAAFADGADLSTIEADLALALHGTCESHEEPWQAVLALDLVVDSIDAL